MRATLAAVATLATTVAFALSAGAQEPAGRPADSPSGGAAVGFDPAGARALAGQIASEIGLPPGGNVNGIHWEQAGGVFSRAEIEFVVRYNAACQWLRAFATGRQRHRALDVLRAAPNWPQFAGGEIGGHAEHVAADAGDGSLDSEAARHLSSCEASAELERRYAASRGERPTT